MAELGLIAAVVQVADVGFRLSEKLYTFGQTVASADDSILFISKDISHTCSILRTLEHSLEKDREAELYSQNAVSTAETIVKECLEIFHDMDRALLKKITRIGLDGSSSRAAVTALERLRWPFLKPKMMLLWRNLGKLKSSLQLMLNVFIYARLLVERKEEPFVLIDQHNMINHLLRTTAEQSRNCESLKIALDRSENPDGSRDSARDDIPTTPGLDAGTTPGEMLSKSRTSGLLEAPRVDPTTTKAENYYTLMEHLMAEVEAEEYNIEPEVRRRIRDDVIRTHKRETGLLRAVHGHTGSKEKMRDSSWRLTETTKDKADNREQPPIVQSGERSPVTKSDPFLSYYGAQSLDFDPRQSTKENATQEQMEILEEPPTEACTTAMIRAHAPEISPIETFLAKNIDSDPWNHIRLLVDAPLIDQPKAAEENGWLPYWRSGASMRAFNRILPLNPLKAQLPFQRSCTSMLVTEKSHELESITSSQDLVALTDSTDTDTFVSARSELDDMVLDIDRLCLEGGDKDGPLVIPGNQVYSDIAGKDDGRLAEFDPFLDEFREPQVILP